MKKVPDYHELDAHDVSKATENVLNAISDTRAFLTELNKYSKR
jgi:hypothetical protein